MNKIKTTVFQIEAVPGDIKANTDAMLKAMESVDSDMYIFPEMFLTGYFSNDVDNTKEIDIILSYTKNNKKCVVFGSPLLINEKIYNCAVVCSDSIETYKKIHLPNFGIFSEKDRFTNDSEPLMFEFHGMKFGICICYDIFFPEMLKTYSMNGCDCIICISASPRESRKYFEKVLEARALENTCYLVFCNNIGIQNETEFFGGSRIISPLGDIIKKIDEKGCVFDILDENKINEARKIRPTIKDSVELSKLRFVKI